MEGLWKHNKQLSSLSISSQIYNNDMKHMKWNTQTKFSYDVYSHMLQYKMQPNVLNKIIFKSVNETQRGCV